jgi:Leucine-rich repeat (LRR) protein
LVFLDIGGANLSELDITNNPQLEYLSISRNEIITIDLSQSILLKYLILVGNPIENIDLSYNINLETLRCSAVPFTELDSTNNVNLKYFRFGYDGDPHDSSLGLTELDLSNCIALEHLHLTQCNIQSINLNNCPNLIYFDLYGMYNLTSFSVKNGHNEDIDEHTHLSDYNFTDDPLFCVEVDDPEAASNQEYPYNLHWNWMANPQYSYSDDCELFMSENEIEANLEIEIFPNPVVDIFRIENIDVINVVIYNQLGQKMKSIANTNIVNISDLSSGVYFTNITNGKGNTIIKKIIKE